MQFVLNVIDGIPRDAWPCIALIFIVECIFVAVAIRESRSTTRRDTVNATTKPSFLNALGRLFTGLRGLPHMVCVSTRHQQGRLYVFRDRPLWFVKHMATLPVDATTDASMLELVRHARGELSLRAQQVLRSDDRPVFARGPAAVGPNGTAL